MARFYSDLYHDLSVVSGYDSEFRAVRGRGHAARRCAVAQFSFAIGEQIQVGDELRIKSFKAGDRIERIEVWYDDSGATGAFDLGLYEFGQNNDGPLIDDADLFASGVVTSAAAVTYANRIDIWNEAAHFDDFDRFKKLWELVNINTAGTFTDDSAGDFDLTATQTVITDGVAKFEFAFLVEYTSDGN